MRNPENHTRKPKQPRTRVVVGRPFLKGNSDGRAGRKKGSVDKWKTMTDEARRQLADKKGGITPLQFLLSVLRNPNASLKWKLKCAQVAAPYMHRKMPIAIEGGNTPLTFLDAAAMSKLTTKELDVLYAVLGKIGALPDSEIDKESKR